MCGGKADIHRHYPGILTLLMMTESNNVQFV